MDATAMLPSSPQMIKLLSGAVCMKTASLWLAKIDQTLPACHNRSVKELRLRVELN